MEKMLKYQRNIHFTSSINNKMISYILMSKLIQRKIKKNEDLTKDELNSILKKFMNKNPDIKEEESFPLLEELENIKKEISTNPPEKGIYFEGKG